MSTDGFSRFLEAVVLDEALRALSHRDLDAAVLPFCLSDAELAFLRGRLKNGSGVQPKEAPGLMMHFRSIPEDVDLSTPEDSGYLTPETDVTFDVKPNVVIPPP